MSSDPKLYTWRNLPCPFDVAETMEICWTQSGWIHAAIERGHFHDAATLWRRVFDKQVIDPVLTLKDNVRGDELRQTLFPFCQRLHANFASTLGLPRVIKMRTSPRNRHDKAIAKAIMALPCGCITPILLIRENAGVLNSIFFSDGLVRGLALFPQSFESQAVEYLISVYADNNRLTNPNDLKFCVQRRNETDRQICFIEPRKWGFESDVAGAPWIGYQDPANCNTSDLPLAQLDRPVD